MPIANSLISQPIIEESDEVLSAGSDPSIKERHLGALTGFKKLNGNEDINLTNKKTVIFSPKN